jgi:hypothetical protein
MKSLYRFDGLFFFFYLTHKLTQNRKFSCGNNGIGGVKENLIPEQTTPNRAKWVQSHLSDKLRTRRPGVRIPQGVPVKPADSSRIGGFY